MWQNYQVLYSKIKNFNQKYPDFCFTDIFEFCKKQGILVGEYSNKDRELCEISKDGFTFYEDGQYTIFYNKDKLHQRIRFTIAHELGHIFLKHHKYVKINMLAHSYNNSPVWEQQANIFARNVLFPYDLAHQLENFGTSSIAHTLDLSVSMVEFRFKFLKQDTCYFEFLERSKI